MDGHSYPAMYPFGLSLILVPVYALFGSEISNGVCVGFISGVLAVWLTYVLAKTVFGRAAGGIAVCFLLLSESFRQSVQQGIASEPPAIFLCIMVYLMLLYLQRRTASPVWAWLVLGGVIGFSTTIRLDNVLLLLPLAAVYLFWCRTQQQILAKTVLLLTGLAVWWLALFAYNWRYTGDGFRDGIHIYNSALCDRTEGAISLRHLADPSFRQSYLGRALYDAPFQWSDANWNSFAASSTLDGWPIRARLQKAYYWIVDALFCIGVIVTIVSARTNITIRHFGVWTVLWIVGLFGWLSCIFGTFDQRHMLRLVPFVCILDAFGLICALKALGHLRPTIRRLQRWRILYVRHARAYAYMAAVVLRTALCAAVFSLGGFLLLTPNLNSFHWAHVAAYQYLQHCLALIPDNAVIITNIGVMRTEYLSNLGCNRRVLPLHRDISGAERVVTLHKPPHPEWIVEDLPTRSATDNPVNTYKRMHENGSEYAYKFTAVDNNSDIVDLAIRTQRPVYLISTGVFTDSDLQALRLLDSRYTLRILEKGFNGNSRASKFTGNFFIAELRPKLGITIN